MSYSSMRHQPVRTMNRKRKLVSYSLQPLPEAAQQQEGHRFGVNKLLTLRNGTELLSAGRDGIIRRWDVAASRQQQQQQPQCTAKLEGHTDWVTDIAVAHDRVLISCSNDGSLKLWDLGCDLPKPAAPGADPVSCSPVTPTMHYFKACDLKCTLLTDSMTCSHSQWHPQHWNKQAVHVLLQSHLYYYSEAAVACHSAHCTVQVSMQQTGNRIASAGLDRRILVWDLQTMVAPLVLLSDAAKSAQHQPQQQQHPSTTTTAAAAAAAAAADTADTVATPGALQAHMRIITMKVSVRRAF
eukprot:3961-Heterococcus_DN1.PRE.4